MQTPEQKFAAIGSRMAEATKLVKDRSLESEWESLSPVERLNRAIVHRDKAVVHLAYVKEVQEEVDKLLTSLIILEVSDQSIIDGVLGHKPCIPPAHMWAV